MTCVRRSYKIEHFQEKKAKEKVYPKFSVFFSLFRQEL